MNIDYRLIGTRIAAFRKMKGWTQEKLAEKADLSNNYVSNIENNHSIPSLETLMKICIAFDVTPNDILLGTSKEEKAYMVDDIGTLLAQCTAQEKRYVLGIIRVILAERENAL